MKKTNPPGPETKKPPDPAARRPPDPAAKRPPDPGTRKPPETKKGEKKKEDKRKKEEKKIEDEETIEGLDGKWGWFVVFNSFICNMIVDGTQYTFSNFLNPISEDLGVSISVASLVGSLLSGFYNFSGPIAGALGNKFGFRMVIITGSIISSAGLMTSYFATSVEVLCILYGVIGGLGFGMIYMSSVIMTSLYFHKYRALAASLSVCGTGVGTFLFAPLGTWLVNNWGWRLGLVTEGGIVLICILCGLSFKPIKLISVVPFTREGSNASYYSIERPGSVYYPAEDRKTLRNEAYPTFKEAMMDERRSTVTSIQARSHRSSYSSLVRHGTRIYSIIENPRWERPQYTRKKKCRHRVRIFCYSCWHCQRKFEDLSFGDRPMYRDDIFYGGSIASLKPYSNTEGVNYHLSVTRIPTANEIEQHSERKCCVCHPAVSRTCFTMFGCNLLKSKIFLFLCISSFFYTMGLYIPFVYIRKLAAEYSVPDDTEVWLLSAIGISNTCGRLLSGLIKSFLPINAAIFVLACLFVGGVFCFIFFIHIDVVTLFLFACVFGLMTAPFVSLRPVIIVDFLGLEKLTNAFGLVLMGQGIASISGPPLAGVFQESTGKYEYTIYLCGAFMLMSGMMLLTSAMMFAKSNKAKNNES